MNDSNVIAISGLTKQFGGKEVLRIENLQIRKGSITAVIGPSGAGKSTLLRIVNLLEPPTQGELRYFGAPLPSGNAEKLALQRRMNLVFQKPALLERTVYDNVAFGLRARGFPAQETDRRVKGVLGKVGMLAQSRQRAKTLSGGEAQRVAFARSLVLEPELLLLDEPTANLDPANVELLEKMILGLNREKGTTVLIVTHNLFQARRLATDLLFLFQGFLVEAGETANVFENPSREETRAFIEGRMIY